MIVDRIWGAADPACVSADDSVLETRDPKPCPVLVKACNWPETRNPVLIKTWYCQKYVLMHVAQFSGQKKSLLVHMRATIVL